MHRLSTTDHDFVERFASFLQVREAGVRMVGEAVAAIIARVRAEGDAALVEYTRAFDQFAMTPETMRVTPQEIASAVSLCSPEVMASLKMAAARIKAYSERQMPSDLDYTDELGVRLGHRWSAVEAVGLYVPGGLAAYPSSVLMNAVPARVAGVERLVMTVPAPGGALSHAVLAAAHVAGVDEIYKIGGAQAVAALAYGTQTIRPVDKIAGPGNAYVAEAKRQVFGAVGIDMIAGPSEILVVADNNNDPAWIAADLLSQAEHDMSAQSILIVNDAAFGDAVAAKVDDVLATLPRRAIAKMSWDTHGALIVVRSWEEAVPLIDAIAPEHLELAVDNPEALMRRIRHAGAIFLGRYAPEALGDYVAGPSHVLPTSRTARFSSGLSVFDFLKRSSIIGCTEEAFRKLAHYAGTLARAEGLEAHALSVSVRDKPR